MKTYIILIIAVFFIISATFSAKSIAGLPTMPIPVDESRSALSRWLNKKVIESRLLDDMETTTTWSHYGVGEMRFTRERFFDGKQAVRLVCPTKPEKPNTKSGRPFGECAVRRVFDNEDWRKYNRISVRVYPDLPGFKTISLLVKLYNRGEKTVPDRYYREGLNYVNLKSGQWNQVVFEIEHLARDRVTGVEFVYRMQGNEPGATNIVCYDFDKLELQFVEPDHFEGWNVAQKRIAYSHSGYQLGSGKIAISSEISDKTFRLVDNTTGKVLLTKPVRFVGFGETPFLPTNAPQSNLKFVVMDFSEIDKPGIFRLELGDIQTQPFKIGDDVWLDSIWKTINFFFCERCGFAVPGIHEVCHSDWQAKRGDKTIVINGGWHDAGDLSQGLVNTSEAVWSMFTLAERLKESSKGTSNDNIYPQIADRLIQEAVWGLKWILKTRFPDDARVTWATMDYWTDGVIGTADDTFGDVGESPFDFFLASSAEATAARVLKDINPTLADESLKTAVQDYETALKKTQSPNLSLASAGVLTAAELFRASGEKGYLDNAVELANAILESQQTEYTDWDVPFVGFFYTSPRKNSILHYAHRGHEQAPIVALATLCNLLPEHPSWINWYSAVVLHSEYMKKISQFTRPYMMLPASIYSIDESKDERFKEQVKNGARLSEKYYLRMFPVWFDFRGNSGTVLSQTKGISTAATLRNDTELFELAQKQLQWHVGLNPFCQSIMYGEGYDYAPQYTAMSGDITGSLPVGIQTRENLDLPYWPAANCYNYKEVWVHPSGRWLSIMADVFPPANPTVDSKIKGLNFDVFVMQQSEETVEITLTALGKGKHKFAIRGWNLSVEKPEQTLELNETSTKKIVWNAKINSKKQPWIAVIIPDDNIKAKKETIKKPFLK